MTPLDGTCGAIPRVFAGRRSEGRAALIPYVTAGYPTPADTVSLLAALADAGADVLEVGVPFSDPLADGPVIQRASFASLAAGTTLAAVLEAVRSFRDRRDTPVVLFTYLNPVLRYGPERFLADSVRAGADGVLLTDLPAGADPELERLVAASPLDLVRLVAPTTAPERIGEVAAGGSGFLYYVSRTGVTGVREELRDELAREVETVRERVALPVAVGFGISRPEHAAAVAAVADGVVVGSALLQALDEGGVEGAVSFLSGLRSAMDGAGADGRLG